MYLIKGVFAVGTTDRICGRSFSLKIPVDMNSIILKLSHDQRDLMVPYLRNLNFRSNICRFLTDEEYYF